ncbi:hypothetical protein HDU93_007523 [Gonapodya sp. JEL0774]|nr:hypothetical protein HDU93_007523 [Gonapodya sp. JEL0774]
MTAAAKGLEPQMRFLLPLSTDRSGLRTTLSPTDKASWSALHLAASSGHTSSVNALLSFVSDDVSFTPDLLLARTSNGSTPFLLSIFAGHLETAPSLVNCPALISWISGTVSTRPGPTKAARLLVRGDSFERSPLHHAALVGAVESIAAILHEHEQLVGKSVDINLRDGVDGWTPLQYAAKENQLRVITQLLELGGSPFIVDAKGRSPGSLARVFRKFEAAEILDFPN